MSEKPQTASISASIHVMMRTLVMLKKIARGCLASFNLAGDKEMMMDARRTPNWKSMVHHCHFKGLEHLAMLSAPLHWILHQVMHCLRHWPSECKVCKMIKWPFNCKYCKLIREPYQLSAPRPASATVQTHRFRASMTKLPALRAILDEGRTAGQTLSQLQVT